MPLGKQAAPGIFSFLFPDGCGKAQDAPPNLFPVFFPSALSIGSAFINTTPTFRKRSGSFVFPSHSGLGKMMVPPLCKNTPVHNGRVTLAGRKIFCAFRIVPPSPRAVWESPWGLNFHESRNIKHCSHLFSSMGAFVFPIPCGIGGKDGATPLQKCIGA